MEKSYNPKEAEEKIYKFWEEKGYFKSNINKSKKPFTILLPPPNASGRMHTGNVLMIAIEDLLIRWHRMKGDPTLWIPGTDHAGTETQITFERELKKQGKSRFNFNREDLYKQIWNFVQNNRHVIEDQIKEMGASVDWSRYTFTLDDKVIKTVYATFKKMTDDGLVYRGEYMVNYCPKCGTTYSDVEISHIERKDPLYYMKYGPFVLATVRPETKFGDTAVAVNPKDKRYKEWIGKEIEVEGLIGKVTLKVIGDDYVDQKFGTGVVKVTPAHDKNDYDAGLRHHLEIRPVIDLNGKLNERAGKYAGLSVFEARKKVVEDLEEKGLIEKMDENYLHTISVCKAGHEIEPMVLPNWFIRVDDKKKSLKKPAYDAVKSGQVKILPKWQEKRYFSWIEEMRDWPISRQNTWGIRIPVWYSLEKNPTLQVSYLKNDGQRVIRSGEGILEKNEFEEAQKGLQKIIAPIQCTSELEPSSPKEHYLQETDTFDTWFSSGQWPLVTLGYPDSEDFKYFYPTSVMETGWEIMRLWVSRMIMFGMYMTGKPPFEYVYLHGRVMAPDGRKMSKSLGNVINPEEYLDQYGADALRMGLISGTATGQDFSFPKDKILGYKHFANKIWNMARFMLMMIDEYGKELSLVEDLAKDQLTTEDRVILSDLNKLIKVVDASLEKFRFTDAAEGIYQFMWHTLADKYIEEVKKREDKEVALSVLRHVYMTSLTLLHPFMPFVTEAIYQQIPGRKSESIMIQKWPSE